MSPPKDPYRFFRSTIKVPSWAFKPDDWTNEFLVGLAELSTGWRGKRVWEIGVGTGINLVMLSTAKNVEWYFSDFDERCVPLALENIRRFTRNNRQLCKKLHPLFGVWDIFTPLQESGVEVPKVDVVYGCLPQVPAHIDLSVGDRIAHYYDPERYPEAHLHALGLGLVETLLTRAREVLNPKGSVVLNLAGRPGRKRLLSLFRKAGYEPHVVHSASIAQHQGTSLASLAELEKNGHDDFEFFNGFDCQELIDAREAEARRLRGESIYHNIYVIVGTLS
ncbi:MAG: hypothetical protein Q7R64_04560 [bacterium]|nr:hypothetical protein [bacterium]